MAETKKTAAAKTAAKAEAKKAETTTAAAQEAPKAEAKKSTAKKTTAKKTTTKKAAAKTTTVKAAAKKADSTAVVHLQFAGKSYTTEDLVKSAKDVWQYDLNQKPEDFKTVSLYVKPEENLVYYVINDEVSGNFYI